MTRKKWTAQEEAIIIKFYGKVTKNEICSLLLNRTWDAIKLKAAKLGIHYADKKYLHQFDLSSLLLDDPYSFYWIGFLLADGSFSKNRLILTLSSKDHIAVEKFASFIKGRANKKNYRGIGISSISAQDPFCVSKIKEKFNIIDNKTYNPPDLSLYCSGDLGTAMLIGFIDGDGNISKQYKRKDCLIRIKLHSTWLKVLNDFCRMLENQLNIKLPKAIINNQGYAQWIISNSIAVKYLKKQTERLKLPVLERKWSLIDTNYISRQEKAIETRNITLKMKSQGYRQTEIAQFLGVGDSCISQILKRNKIVA